MSEPMMQEILKRLDTIGGKLGEGAAFSWGTFMKQAFWVDGVVSLIACLAGLVAAYFAIRLAAWMFKRSKRADEKHPYTGVDGDLWSMGGWATGFVCVIVAVVSILSIPGAISHMVNPGYYALMDLARLLGR